MADALRIHALRGPPPLRDSESESESVRQRVTETEELAGRLDPSARSIRARGECRRLQQLQPCLTAACWTAGSSKLSRVYQKY